MKRSAIAHMQNMMAKSVKSVAMAGITGKNEKGVCYRLSLKLSSVFA